MPTQESYRSADFSDMSNLQLERCECCGKPKRPAGGSPIWRQPDTILDPMAGIGTSLVAALMGRNVICNEMEHHFLLPMVRSWEKMRQHPMLGYEMGHVQMLWGDARNLLTCKAWPYDGLALRFPRDSWGMLRARRRKFRLPLIAQALPLPDASVGAAITSPPYSEALAHGGGGANAAKGLADGYARSVDTIVTSPPFKNTRPFASPIGGRSTADYSRIPYEKRGFLMKDDEYQQYLATCNVGNLRGPAYFDSMSRIYAECWRVLKPGGILALVLKGYTRAGVYQNLPAQTEALLLEAGWLPHDHWRRELWSLSFWRILQKRRDPAAFDERLNYEEVLAFRKPEGEGEV